MQNIHQHLPQETKGTYLKIHFPGQDLKQKNLESTTSVTIIIPQNTSQDFCHGNMKICIWWKF
jgi:hypothetical protein